MFYHDEDWDRLIYKTVLGKLLFITMSEKTFYMSRFWVVKIFIVKISAIFRQIFALLNLLECGYTVLLFHRILFKRFIEFYWSLSIL